MGTTVGDVGLEPTAADAVKKRPHFRGTDTEHLILKQKSQISSEPSVSSDFYDHFITISD